MLKLPIDGVIISMSIKTIDFEKFKPNFGFSAVLLMRCQHPYCTTVDSD
jgi:hypothetical protein